MRIELFKILISIGMTIILMWWLWPWISNERKDDNGRNN